MRRSTVTAVGTRRSCRSSVTFPSQYGRVPIETELIERVFREGFPERVPNRLISILPHSWLLLGSCAKVVANCKRMTRSLPIQ